ncbi:hypothetical protein KKD80_00680 [Patescibacteria group bacterium]|nr:hypothetical protein [Patescibacteria group bacterium]
MPEREMSPDVAKEKNKVAAAVEIIKPRLFEYFQQGRFIENPVVRWKFRKEEGRAGQEALLALPEYSEPDDDFNPGFGKDQGVVSNIIILEDEIDVPGSATKGGKGWRRLCLDESGNWNIITYSHISNEDAKKLGWDYTDYFEVEAPHLTSDQAGSRFGIQRVTEGLINVAKERLESEERGVRGLSGKEEQRFDEYVKNFKLAIKELEGLVG